MKVTGKARRMFIGDKEIQGMTSFSLDTGNTDKYKTVVFEGIYDPVDADDKSWESISTKLGKEFMGTITLPNGEKRDALLRASYQDGMVTIKPIEKEIQEWCKKGIL
jgi:hypothetical protein